ncbi:unnamed protein product [Zymoseptoria tritici ST99CH_3D1]|uniref:Methyltransferase n=1 Tax=Zymoseptoria tritici ST99CH_1E4 TaxID=1276532 RepID=A0A2H1GNY7_ZYMTR|nr:unnamed protein product [Zymoseptoria tritici ST99CH_1E4]SMR57573.1 unnamed protein product [Zymoseptoria tritici ST99CH_3D1]
MAATMNPIHASIDFLADRYQEEKPYYLHPASGVDIDLEAVKLSNVIWDPKPVPLRSMRDANVSLEKTGFCFIEHESKFLPEDGSSGEVATAYQRETEQMLQEYFEAELVTCYDYRRRRNAPVKVEAYDPDDPQHVDQVAKGAHDITIDTITDFVSRLLTPEQQREFLSPGYRIRIVNTWRTINPVCEDRPLAVCDASSIDAKDLIPTDRVYPQWLQEIYHLSYNETQRWYWLPLQRSNEPLVFLSYDSKSESNARFCPHVSFDNPLAGPEAPRRHSVETRSLVITREKW